MNGTLMKTNSVSPFLCVGETSSAGELYSINNLISKTSYVIRLNLSFLKS